MRLSNELSAVQSKIYEGLAPDFKRVCPQALASAVPPDADLSGVWPAFVERVLENPESGLIRLAQNNLQRAGMQMVSQLYREKCRELKKWAKASFTSYRGATTGTKAMLKSSERSVIAGIVASMAANSAAHVALTVILQSTDNGEISAVTQRHAAQHAELFVAKAADAQAALHSDKAEAEAARQGAYVRLGDILLQLLLEA